MVVNKHILGKKFKILTNGLKEREISKQDYGI